MGRGRRDRRFIDLTLHAQDDEDRICGWKRPGQVLRPAGHTVEISVKGDDDLSLACMRMNPVHNWSHDLNVATTSNSVAASDRAGT